MTKGQARREIARLQTALAESEAAREILRQKIAIAQRFFAKLVALDSGFVIKAAQDFEAEDMLSGEIR